RLPAGCAVEVRYEAMVSEPAATARLLADFLDVSPAGRTALGAALAGARPDSVGRWRAALGGPELARVQAEIGPLLAPRGRPAGLPVTARGRRRGVSAAPAGGQRSAGGRSARRHRQAARVEVAIVGDVAERLERGRVQREARPGNRPRPVGVEVDHRLDLLVA